MPLVGKVLRARLNTVFPANVLFGDIVKGLPVKENSCAGVYASHVLEHLALLDFRAALQNTYRILQPGGTFRCIVPDLEYSARKYLQGLENGYEEASLDFIDCDLLLGLKKRPKGVIEKITYLWSNLHHSWMWDAKSMAKELRNCGFREIHLCKYIDSEDPMFKLVEDADRFKNSVAFDCKK